MKEAVQAELRRRGDLVCIARDSGLSYDTVRRIRDDITDPAYGKVRKLHEFLFRKRQARSKTLEVA